MHVYRRVECFFILTHLHIIYLDHTLRFAAMMSFKTHPGVRERVFKIVIKTLTVPTKCDRIHVYRRVSCSLSWHTYISSTSTTPNVKCDVSQIWLFKLKTYTTVTPWWKNVDGSNQVWLNTCIQKGFMFLILTYLHIIYLDHTKCQMWCFSNLTF